MGYLVAEQTTATAISDVLTTLINWVDVSSYEDLRIVVENTGGGSADPITDVQTDESTDGITASALDQAPGVPNVPIMTGNSMHEAYAAGAWGTTYLRVRALCAGTNDTTAKAWLFADTYTVDVDTYALTSLAAIKQYLGITSTSTDGLLRRLINSVTDAIETYCGRKFKQRAYTMERYHGNGTRELPLENWPIISVERVANQTEGAIEIECTDGEAYAADVEVLRSGDPAANVSLELAIHYGSGDSDTSLSFSAYPVLSDLAAAITATAGWGANIMGGHGNYASAELIPVGALESLNTSVIWEVPYLRLNDFNIDHENGILYRGGGWSEGFENIYVNYNAGYATIPPDLEQIAIKAVADAFNSRNVNRNVKSEKIGDYAYTLADSVQSVKSYEGDLDKWRRIEYA